VKNTFLCIKSDMVEIFFSVLLLILFFFYYKNKKKRDINIFQEKVNKRMPDIKNQLQNKGFELLDVKIPHKKEVWKSYPYNYYKPAIISGGRTIHTLGNPFDLKIIFKNQYGSTCECWLQITENPFNSIIGFNWQPSLDVFLTSKNDIIY
jgi:hypothetical protein